MLDVMETLPTMFGGNTFQFSAVKPEKLGATEYTLVQIACDVTGSVGGFAPELLKCVQSAVGACRKSPRSDNLMIRRTDFNSGIGVNEVHGFQTLNLVDENKYAALRCNHLTNLFDASHEAIDSVLTYGKKLADQDFDVNGIIFIITDGDDNASTFTAKSVGSLIEKAKLEESLESLMVILVGVNTSDRRMKLALERFQKDAGLTQFVDIGDATPEKLARLGQFISKSISSQSQSLGTGGPSQPLTF